MYRSPAGDEYFVVDSHLHFWDASPENCKNEYGSGFISCFYDYHTGLTGRVRLAQGEVREILGRDDDARRLR